MSAQVLAEVDAALRNGGAFITWWQTEFGMDTYVDPAAPVIAADYLRAALTAAREEIAMLRDQMD